MFSGSVWTEDPTMHAPARPTLAAAVAAALLLSACTTPPEGGTAATDGSEGSSPGSTVDAASADFDPADLPSVPQTAPLSGTDPTARAAELVAATADDVADVGPGWLAAYAEFGVPVLDPRDRQEPVDPVGPAWSRVWSVGQISRGTSTVPAYDAARALSFGLTPGTTGEALLADLRAGATSEDPQTQTLARFIAGKSVSSGWQDPLDPSATVEGVAFDAATIQMIGWVVLRDALLRSVTPDEIAAAQVTGSAAGPAIAEIVPAVNPGVGSGKPCSEAFGDSDQTSWINWVVGKIGNGIGGAFNGPGLPALVVTVLQGLESLGQDVRPAIELSEKVAQIINHANVIASIASLIAQVNALTLDVSPQDKVDGQGNPLAPEDQEFVRNKEASDGATQKINVRLTYDFNLLDIDKPIACAVTFLINALGVGLSVPKDGARVGGAEILASPGLNMPEKIYFGGPQDLKFSTNPQGEGVVTVLGHARKKSLPESARRKPSEFSLYFSAQVEEVGLQSILNTLIDGLAVNVGGVLSSAVDIAKTMHYDFDDPYVLPYVDWETVGYRVDTVWPGSSYRFTGTICDIAKPFVLQTDGSASSAFVGALTVSPTGENGDTLAYTFQGSFGGVAPGNGSGLGTIDLSSDPPVLNFGPGQWFAVLPFVGNKPIGPDGGQHWANNETLDVVLIPDETLECPES